MADEEIGKNGRSGYVINQRYIYLGLIILIVSCVYIFLAVNIFLIRVQYVEDVEHEHSLILDTYHTQMDFLYEVDSLAIALKKPQYVSDNIHAAMDTTRAGALSRSKQLNDDRNNDITVFFVKEIILLLSSIGLVFLALWIFKRKIFYFCSNQKCYSAVFISFLENINCPSCNRPSKSQWRLIRGKCYCKVKLKYQRCPHCSKEEDLFALYNHEEIKQKIYET